MRSGFRARTWSIWPLAACFLLLRSRLFRGSAGGRGFACVRLNRAMVAGAGIAYPTGDLSFKVYQPFPKVFPAEQVDPFLMCDEWGRSLKKMGEASVDPGAPDVAGERHANWHPHRGFDILSYVKEGRGRHADSLGNKATVRPGGLQWMRTGSGVEHAEGGGTPEGANKHGFQIWINLPAELKMAKPEYGTTQPEDVPEVRSPSGAVSRLLAGRQGACFPSREDIHIADCELPGGASHVHLLPGTSGKAGGFETLVVYVYRGQGVVGGRALGPQQGASLSLQVEGQTLADLAAEGQEEQRQLAQGGELGLEIETGEAGLGLLVFAGRKLRQPIAWNGPVVMNTDLEIREAFDELRRGSFLKERAPYDFKLSADQE
mmetsp:Transcript_105324/g.339353  ORF Transcript_105324/g.339353 Transcript_105324/m.339353 type:complete len:375 (-) Transcript_105324:562-1686(-)